MQRRLMSALVEPSHKIWMPLDFVSDQKERGADFMLRQRLQHPRRVARMRTVVEGEGDLGEGGGSVK